MSVFADDPRRELEIRHFPILVYAMVPLTALLLQSWLPRMTGRFTWYDLPLVATVYFSLARRNPVQGTLLGAVVGLMEDALTHRAIGINGIAKTVAGFLAASVGVRLDVENHSIRLLLTLLLSMLASLTYLFVVRVLLNLPLEWSWWSELFKALGSTLIAALTYPLLDRTLLKD